MKRFPKSFAIGALALVAVTGALFAVNRRRQELLTPEIVILETKLKLTDNKSWLNPQVGLKWISGTQLIAMTPSGRTEVLTRENGIKGVELQDRKQLYTAFAPNLKLVAEPSRNRTEIQLRNVESGKKLRLFRVPSGQILPPAATNETDPDTVTRALAISPDGRWLAGACSSKTSHYFICVWNLVSTRVHHTLDMRTTPISDISFSPDGSLLAVASGTAYKTVKTDEQDGFVTAWHVGPKKQQFRTRVSDGVVDCVVFSPDGEKLAVIADDTTLSILDSKQGKILRGLKNKPVQVNDHDVPRFEQLAFSPDGNVILGYGTSGVRFWGTNTGGLIGQAKLPGAQSSPSIPTDCEFSPDGKLLAVRSQENKLYILPVPTV